MVKDSISADAGSKPANEPPPSSAQLRAARAWLDLTQAEVAEKAGLTKRTLIRIEAGRTPNQGDTMATLRKVFEVLGVAFQFAGGEAIGVTVAPRATPARRRKPEPKRKTGPEPDATVDASLPEA